MSEPDPQQLHELIRSHKEHMRTLRRDNTQRLALHVLVALALAYVVVRASRPVAFATAVVILGWFAWSMATMWPRRCTICDRRTQLIVPGDTPYVPRKWWDLRPPSLQGGTYVCLEHIGVYMLAKATRRSGGDERAR